MFCLQILSKGLVIVPSSKGTIVKKLHGDYYEIEAPVDSEDSDKKHHLALHACPLAPYRPGSKQSCTSENEDAQPIVASVTEAISQCAHLQKHKYFTHVTSNINDESMQATAARIHLLLAEKV